jgi:transcriptional regulator with XRE-family HTH domain
MATTNKAIGARVRTLLDGRGMTQSGLAEILNVDPGGISRAIAGERAFKAREIAMIAEAFNVSPAVILEGAQDEEPALFAARQSVHSHGAVVGAIDRAEFFVDLADVIGADRKPKALKASLPQTFDYAAGQEFATQVLRESGLGQQPLPVDTHGLAAALENSLGLEVALEPLGHGLDGMAVTSSRFKLAMVSSSIAPARQRWTMAHEVGHLLMGDSQDILVDSNIYAKAPAETRANAFAAAFLMPSELLTQAWGTQASISETRVAAMLDVFGVSQQALAYRLHNVGLVNAAGRDKILSLRPLVSVIRNQGTRQSEGYWLPSGLTRDAIQAYEAGKLGIRWIANLTHLEADDLLSRLRPDLDELESLTEQVS